MPSIDLARGRARLTLDHVAVLAALRLDRPVPERLRAEHAQLLAAGLIDADGQPVAALRPLLRVLSDADLLIDITTTAAGTATGHGAWLAGSDGVTAEGWPGDAECEYAPLEPAMLPWAISRIVGLRRNPLPEVCQQAPTVLTEVRAPSRLVDGAIEAIVGLGPRSQERAREAAVDVLEQNAGLDADDRRTLITVVNEIRSTWSVTTRWRDGTGRTLTASLTVLDAGSVGYWQRQELDQADVSTMRIIRTSAADLWRALISVLPGQAPPTHPPSHPDPDLVGAEGKTAMMNNDGGR
jgi:hypothetical protein